jgi:murein peptide amidase A
MGAIYLKFWMPIDKMGGMRSCQQAFALIAMLLIAICAHATQTCDEFYARLPNVSRALCDAAQLQASTGRSVKGRPLYTRDIQPTAAQWRVLVVGGIHGDELSASSVALHWIRLAQADPSQTYWRFVPALNPDGLFARPARRVNANGVDLNRNFPTPNWEREATFYWEGRTRKDPRRWPGKRALSEPETQFLNEEMQRFKPHLIVSIHAPYGVLDFDGPTEPPQRLGRLRLVPVGVFPGSLGNYSGVHQNVPVVTIELPSASLTPRDAEIERMWLDLRRWMGESMAQQSATASPEQIKAHQQRP